MNLFDFNIPEWFFVALNLLILTFILWRIFWKPVNKILDARQALADKTARDNQEAERLRAETEQAVSRFEGEIDEKTRQLMSEAKNRADTEYSRIVGEAEEQARNIHSTAKAKAEREFEKSMAEAKTQVSSMAVEAVTVLLRENMDSDRNKKVVERFLAERDAYV